MPTKIPENYVQCPVFHPEEACKRRMKELTYAEAESNDVDVSCPVLGGGACVLSGIDAIVNMTAADMAALENASTIEFFTTKTVPVIPVSQKDAAYNLFLAPVA